MAHHLDFFFKFKNLHMKLLIFLNIYNHQLEFEMISKAHIHNYMIFQRQWP
jgi:hypothetical protein